MAENIKPPKMGTIHLITKLSETKSWCGRVDSSRVSNDEMTADESFTTCLTCRAMAKWSEDHSWQPVPDEIREAYQYLGDGEPINLQTFWSWPHTIQDQWSCKP